MPRRGPGPKPGPKKRPGPKPGPKRGPGPKPAKRARRRSVRRVRRRTRRRRIIVAGAAVMMIGGAYTSYKVSKEEAQQIEEYAGKPVEELSEQEMDAALDELGIQDQELTAADEAAIEAEAV